MQFWGQALEYRNPLIGIPPADIAAFRAENPQFDGRGRIDDNELRRTPVYIQRVPEPKTERNRVRLEVSVDDPAGVNRLVELGARQVAEAEFTDVEGNEFTIASTNEGPTRLSALII